MRLHFHRRRFGGRYSSARDARTFGALIILIYALSRGDSVEQAKHHFLDMLYPPLDSEGNIKEACPGEAKKVAHAPWRG